jgi:hypothetical protein
VALGLIWEYWKPVGDVVEVIKFCRKEGRAFRWKGLLELGAGILITLGVVGELGSTFKASSVENKLRENNGKIEQLLNTEAGNAQTSADNAANAADRANVSAQHAEQDAIRLNLDLVKEVKRETEAERQLEDEKKKRLELAASLLPRDLCEQYGPGAVISRFPGRRVIFEYVSEKEPRRLAEQIAWVFMTIRSHDSSHWSVRRRAVDEDAIQDGVYIMSGWASQSLPNALTPEERQRAIEEFNFRKSSGMKLAVTLRDALTRCGIEATAGEDTFAELDPHNDGVPADALVIRIGSKPNRALESTIRELGPFPLSLPPGSNVAVGNLFLIPDESTPSHK